MFPTECHLALLRVHHARYSKPMHTQRAQVVLSASNCGDEHTIAERRARTGLRYPTKVKAAGETT